MGDYISRNAAIDILATTQGSCTSKAALVQNSKIWKQIKNLPSADVQPVVRCKDCKHWNDAPADDGMNSCEMDALIRHESFFCANGERKDGEQG